jgi:purine-binding chemotaxis protein CheW
MGLANESGSADQARLDVLVFELAEQRFAVPLSIVNEVTRAVAVRALPGAPAVTLGIIDVRGELVPVLDLRGRFRLAPRSLDPGDHFIILQAGARRVAMHVDRALDVTQLAMRALAEAPNLPQAIAHIAGVASTADGLVLLQDAAAFLKQAEAEQMDAALAENRGQGSAAE